MRNLIRFIGYYLKVNRKLYVDETLQKVFSCKKPIKPYAFIRVCNEIKTIDTALHSILPAVEGGVIGFNSCTDGSKEYILKFCKKYPQFTPIEYPYDVIPACDEKYKENSLEKERMLDSYYNFIWDKLPKNEWIIKVDVDHIWFPHFLKNLYKLPISKSEIIILNRINLHVDNGICYINKHNPFTEVGDSWIIYNNSKHKFGFLRGWDNNKFFAWEYLPLPKKKLIYGNLTNYHFPIIKSQRNSFNRNDWIPLDEFDFEDFFDKKNMKGRVNKELIRREFIIEQFNRFSNQNIR